MTHLNDLLKYLNWIKNLNLVSFILLMKLELSKKHYEGQKSTIYIILAVLSKRRINFLKQINIF
jgi:hypothetical protein